MKSLNNKPETEVFTVEMEDTILQTIFTSTASLPVCV